MLSVSTRRASPKSAKCGSTLSIEQDVSWLDVTVQDAALVRVLHGPRQARDDFRRASQRNDFPPNEMIEVAAFLQLHAEVARAVALADLINRDDAWVLQAGGRFGLAPKALQMRFGRPMSERDHLQGNDPVQTLLARAIDNSLAAATNFLQQFVVAEL